MTLTQEKATEGQIKQLSRMASDAADKAVRDYFDGIPVSKKSAELMKGNSEFSVRIREAATAVLKELSVTDRYKDEEVDSTYGYLSGYMPKSLTEQCNRLRELFQGVGYPNQDLLIRIEKGEVPLPSGAEGWFALPNQWGGVDIVRQFGSFYAAAVQKVLDTINQTRDGTFYNYCKDRVDPYHLHQSKRSEEFLNTLSVTQGNPDILIIPAQFGILHRGRSVRRAREVFVANEFGLGAFAIGIMLLTHPERLQNVYDLWIDCAGDEFRPDDEREFSSALFFFFGDCGVKFNSDWVDRAYGLYGSASAFLPQVILAP